MSAPILIAWCGEDQKCNPCLPASPPQQGAGGGGLPPFELGAVNITQAQTIIGPNGPPSVAVVGQMRIETGKQPVPPDYSTTEIVVITEGAFGGFPDWPAPYITENNYLSTLTITYPWMGNNNYALPTFTVGGDNIPANVNAAEQAAINQAYETLGQTPPPP